MKKILISLSLIGVAAAVTIGATTALFADTETSTGNTFTAGGIDLTVDSLGGKYNGVPIQDGWFAQDLTNQKFFNFSDVKPADRMERNLSLHVESNPAWVCLLAKNVHNDDNGLIDPEIEAGDTGGGPGQGELNKNIHVIGYVDSNANSTHQLNERIFIDSFFDVFVDLSAAVHDSTTGTGPLDSSQNPSIEMIQLDLCAGTHVIDPNTGAISCNGSSMGNNTQTDTLTADLELYVEQSRNNANFRCDGLLRPI